MQTTTMTLINIITNVIYLIGSILFIIGSVFFLYTVNDRSYLVPGVWFFIIGSIFFAVSPLILIVYYTPT